MAKAGVSAFAMELMPRITRAQVMEGVIPRTSLHWAALGLDLVTLRVFKAAVGLERARRLASIRP